MQCDVISIEPSHLHVRKPYRLPLNIWHSVNILSL